MSLGKLEEFLIGKTNWIEYKERLDFYFAANTITDADKKRAIFFSVAGPSLYSLIRSLCTPDAPNSVDFPNILKLLDEHFTPKPSEILCRFKFNKRDQKRNESISEFIAELRKLSEHCNFGVQLESMLRDRLVCGILDEELQRKLLADPKLTLASALDISLAGEAAQRQASEIRGTVQPNSVNFLKPKSNNRSARDKQSKKTCHRCGNSHPYGECKFLKAVCNYCKKIGHIAKMCNSKNLKKGDNKVSSKVQNLNSGECNISQYKGEYLNNIHSISSINDHPPHDLLLDLNGINHKMEIDSGSLHSVISSDTYVKLWPVNPPHLLPVSDQCLRTWNSEELNVNGYFDVNVCYKNRNVNLPLLVLQGCGKSLIGRSWFHSLGIDINVNNSNVNKLSSQSYDSILSKYSDIFVDSLGKFKGPPASIKIDENFNPRFLKARNVPFALRDRVAGEIERMVNEGILEPVEYSDWATPVVPVIKKNGSIRLCGDYRSTVNQAVKQFTYPLPTVNEVLATMTGGTIFSKLDLSEAYLQLPVDDPSSRILTLNTHKGLFKVNRLPFGISTAVAIFQKRMEEMLAGSRGVLPYLDDIYISGKNLEDHNSKLVQVLERLQSCGVHLKREKCKFAVPEIELLGFRVNSKGIQPSPDKVKAIHDAPSPKNKTELQAFLGMLNFYCCFLKNKSEVLEPLHQLLQKNTVWHWTPKHEKAYKAAKDMLTSDITLAHFDEKLPVLLTCDGSPYGVGAVLSHISPSGKEVPIAYHSRSLTKAERNYSQTDREALAIISGVKKFNQYLQGRKFKIVTDHEPLLGLFNPKKPLPQMVSPRVLRWSLILAAYDYELEYRRGKEIPNADALSRLPLDSPDWDPPAPSDVLLLETAPVTQLDSALVSAATKKDPVLSRVLLMTMNGWPSKLSDEKFKPYFCRRNELSVHQNCVLWGSRVIIPTSLQREVLTLLHNGHPGIVRMKGLARSYVWWPHMDSAIENTVKSCTLCQENQRAPAKAPIHPWEWTEKPWSRLHVDFAGPYQGQTFFLVVDSHSKWLEVLPVSSMSASATIDSLRLIFSTHGIPDAIASDNGTTFKSAEFQEFLSKNQIRQIFVAPYHPSSNGQAERMVATTKQALKRIIQGSWKARLARFLFSQHILPCTTTGKSPAELLMNRRLTSLLDRLHPDLNKTMKGKKELQAEGEAGRRLRVFEEDDPVYIRNYSSGPPWIPAEIVEPTGPVSYKTRDLVDGNIAKRHVDQVRSRVQEDSIPSTEVPEGSVPCVPPPSTSSQVEPPTPVPPMIRRSQRIRTAPKHLNDYVLNP